MPCCCVLRGRLQFFQVGKLGTKFEAQTFLLLFVDRAGLGSTIFDDSFVFAADFVDRDRCSPSQTFMKLSIFFLILVDSRNTEMHI